MISGKGSNEPSSCSQILLGCSSRQAAIARSDGDAPRWLLGGENVQVLDPDWLFFLSCPFGSSTASERCWCCSFDIGTEEMDHCELVAHWAAALAKSQIQSNTVRRRRRRRRQQQQQQHLLQQQQLLHEIIKKQMENHETCVGIVHSIIHPSLPKAPVTCFRTLANHRDYEMDRTTLRVSKFRMFE